MSEQAGGTGTETQTQNPNSTDGGAQGGAGAAAAQSGAGAAGAGSAGAGQGGGGQSGGQAAYYEAFQNADLKTHPSIHKYDSVERLAEAYVNLEKRLGGDPKTLIKAPAGPDDKEGHQAIYKALGAPDKVDGYKIDMEGASEADVAAAGKFAQVMFEKGPYPAQFVADATAWFAQEVKTQNEALLAEAAAATQAGEQALKEAWGAAYDQRKGELGKLISDLGGEKLAQELNGSTFGDNPQLALFLGKVLDKMAEPGPKRENSDTGQGAMTPSQATARARELEAHPAFRDPNHTQHAEVVKSRNDALRMAEARPA